MRKSILQEPMHHFVQELQATRRVENVQKIICTGEEVVKVEYSQREGVRAVCAGRYCEIWLVAELW